MSFLSVPVLVLGNDFFGQRQMVLGSSGVCVIEYGRQSVTRCFGELHIALDDGLEYEFLEMSFYFIVNLVGQTETGVVHREQESFYFKSGVQFFLYNLDGVEQFADTF